MANATLEAGKPRTTAPEASIAARTPWRPYAPMWLLCAPALVLFATLVLIPLGMTFVLTFYRFDPSAGSIAAFQFGNYVNVLTSSYYQTLAATPAWAQSKTIYIGMNGGPMEKAYTTQVLPAFEKANNVQVTVVPGTSSDILAKLLANRAHPQVHVASLDDGVMARAVSLGLCEKLDDAPVLKELYPFARMKDDVGAGVQLGMTGIAYNKKLFQEKAAEAGKQIPTNHLAKMPASMQQSLGNIESLVHKVTVVDWDAINAHRAQWDTRWNQQIER